MSPAVVFLLLLMHGYVALQGDRRIQLAVRRGEDWHNNSLGFADADCGGGFFCSSDYPICCGRTLERMYCVTGGDKCCNNHVSVDQSTSCDQNEECCSGPEDIVSTCCSTGQSCAFGYPSSCVVDACAAFSEPGTCVSSNVSLRCKWCCDSHRCMAETYLVSRVCTSIVENTSAICRDPCTNQRTCSRCTISTDALANRCQWCCQTQSCISSNSSVALTPCASLEIIQNDGDCASCAFGGHGVHTSSSPSAAHTEYSVLLISVGVLCVFVIIVSIVKAVVMQRRRQRASNGMYREEAEVSQAVTRYGFNSNASTSEPQREPEQRHTARCDICSEPLLPHETSNVTRSAASTDGPPLETTPLETPQGAQFALLLPCTHRMCYPCLKYTSGAETPDQGFLLGLLKKKCCPKCKKAVDIVFLPFNKRH